MLSDVIWGKFSVFASDSSYISPFLLLLASPLPICHTFCSHSTVLEYSVWGFFQSFFSVAFQFRKFVLTCPQVQRFFLQSHQSTNKPIKANLHFYYSVFDLYISLWFLKFSSLCLCYPSVIACCLLFPTKKT